MKKAGSITMSPHGNEHEKINPTKKKKYLNLKFTAQRK